MAVGVMCPNCKDNDVKVLKGENIILCNKCSCLFKITATVLIEGDKIDSQED